MSGVSVKVEFKGQMRRPCAERVKKLELEEPSDLRGLLAVLGYEESEARALVTLVNGERCARSLQLSSGDHVELLLPIGGG